MLFETHDVQARTMFLPVKRCMTMGKPTSWASCTHRGYDIWQRLLLGQNIAMKINHYFKALWDNEQERDYITESINFIFFKLWIKLSYQVN